MSTMDTEGHEHTALINFLSELGLQKFYPNKLTLQSLLEINRKSIIEEAVSSVEEIPWCFLRKLFRLNAECRSCTQLLKKDDDDDDDEEDRDPLDLDHDSADNGVNSLDLIVALFLCADSFLQQEMALKMSMCQFSVPLLLPHGNNSQCSLMLWALRDIVKEWRPHDLSKTKGLVEDNIIQADIPLFSFVRLKNCSLSKSQCLNQILCHGQQNNNMFIHRDMEGGEHERYISNGLVEVSWFLPCGRENLDIFPEPVAFANLRGDIGQSLAQFTFLYQVSTATFVFFDKVEENEQKILTCLQDVRSKLFLVFNSEENVRENMMSVRTTMKKLNLPNSSVIPKDKKANFAGFSSKLCSSIKKLLRDVKTKISIVNMPDKAAEPGVSVDESKTDQQHKAAQEIMDGIDKQSIPDYKKQQLPLQGENWKRLSQKEKEECRLKDAGASNLEEFKSQLQRKIQKIREKQRKQKLSKGMKSFIKILSTSDKEKRDFFLGWMKFKFNTHSRDKLTELRKEFKEQCEKKNAKLITELDQALLESSLGLEHYMREMGLIYEFSLQSQEISDKISNLPGLAAEMMLDGYPLELLDGEASNIPERWVTDVLMELHKKVKEKSRLLVLTVLGVQSSGKSTLLNTMFGVQFPVSSGRCTRGAYMLFLRVGEDMKSELNFDFILLIDTEGLKSPDMAQLEDSYEHDNQLATFVIGLSDVIIVNIAMENSTEMKDVLQIAAHAFLRMKQIGKKPVCHFVHQNVGGVSAHAENMTERKHLLDQLNEMTQTAAEMEKQHSIKAFTDVMDCDIEKNTWNIPGLWHGTPPMAAVNTGYSEAVADFKKNLLEMMKGDRSSNLTQIPEFLEWMQSLWKAVKHENFIFSFRNTLVAHAYDNLCKEFSQWEREFRKEILSWQTAAELEIINVDLKSELHHVSKLVAMKKSQVREIISGQQNIMNLKLEDYYKQKEKHVHLIEKYKVDFSKNISRLADEIQHSVNNKLDCALELQKSSKEAQDIQRKSRGVIEQRVMKLLAECKHTRLSDDKLSDEFEKMWTEVTVNVSGLKEQDIPAKILKKLRDSFLNRNVNEDFQNIGDLKEYGKGPFEAESKYLKTTWNPLNHFNKSDRKRELQSFADKVIESCTQFVCDIAKTDTDYHDSFTKKLLEKVDESLKSSSKDYELQFEIDLKLHICAVASREFLQMHRRFLLRRDPKAQLERHKPQYLSNFLDLYKKRDDCQRKADNFVKFCIKPAVEEYINRSLGIDIVDEILTSSHSAEFSSRSLFQYNIQKELLQNENFESFVRYIRKYEAYVKDWIFQHIKQQMSEDQTLGKLKVQNLQIIVEKITEAIEKASKGEDGVLLPDDQESITKLINNMRKYLIKDISISEEEQEITLFQIQSTCHPFTKSLMKSWSDLEEQMQEDFLSSTDVTETLNKLPIRPQDELFKRVFGCGKLCPFCKVPCEAGGKDHSQHHAAVHRPKGLGRYRNSDKTLVATLCTTDVHSENKFKNQDTKGEPHPYKEYTTIYPDWHIPPDSSIQASDYWKYVLVKYNERFAKEYKAEPADVPQAWRSITKEQALKGLRDAFSIK